MAKRTSYEVERDVKLIKEASVNVSSFEELSKITGLSLSMINTSLSKHPIVYNRIKREIRERANKISCARKEEATLKASTEDVSNTKKNESYGIFIPNLPSNKVVVIDTSIAGVGRMINLLRVQKEVIILDVVIRELKGIKDSTKKSKSGASQLLYEIAKGNKPFISASANEIFSKVDDTIINYCARRKDVVILFTADQEMAALARGKGVIVFYFERKPIQIECIPVLNENDVATTNQGNTKEFSGAECSTVTQYDGIEYKAGKLHIRVKDIPNKKFVAVCSNDNFYRNADVYLHIGDDILIAKRKDDYFSFAHFKVTSLGKYNNCKLVYTAKLYNKEQVNLLPDTRYISLMREFISSYKEPKK